MIQNSAVLTLDHYDSLAIINQLVRHVVMTSQSLLKKRKKKRKYDDYKGLKLFEDTIKSDLQLQSSNSDDKPCREKELWIFQYPKDVRCDMTYGCVY